MSGMDEDLGKAWRDGCWETAAAHFDEGARELERHGKVPAGMLTGMSPSAREGMLETMVAHAEHEALLERHFGGLDRDATYALVTSAIECCLPSKLDVDWVKKVRVHDMVTSVIQILQSREGTERWHQHENKQAELRQGGAE